VCFHGDSILPHPTTKKVSGPDPDPSVALEPRP
jgi:hypothetical protein